MATPTDMMIQMLLAQITDLQRRVTTLESASGSASGSTTRGTNVAAAPFTPATQFTPQGMRTGVTGTRNIVKHSVPLQNGSGPSDSYEQRKQPRGKPRVGGTNDAAGAPRARGPRIGTVPRDATAEGGHSAPPVALSAILNDGECVTMTIGTGKDEDGNFTNTTCTATFKDEQFTVTASELAPELVDKTFKAPGEVLYKFMDQLKQNGHIKRTFSVAPWKLCTVERDGKSVTLQELRNSTA
jgi:hypothetical protein